jgi:AbiV family abortive infection protein
MKKERNYKLTLEILEQYQSVALENAENLIWEAECLLRAKYWARSYFLACSSIEETGKALMAFSARGRNLKDSAVQSRIKREFEDHGKKNLTALIGLLFQDYDRIKDTTFLDFVVNTSTSLHFGREKSLYADIGVTGKITLPMAIVSERNANDTVNLAKVLIVTVKKYTQSNNPRKCSSWEDKYFVIPNEKTAKMMQSRDFWEYVRSKSQHELKRFDIAELGVKYYEAYFCKKKTVQEIDS